MQSLKKAFTKDTLTSVLFLDYLVQRVRPQTEYNYAPVFHHKIENQELELVIHVWQPHKSRHPEE